MSGERQEQLKQIRERQEEHRRRCELTIKDTDIPLPKSISDIDFLLSSVREWQPIETCPDNTGVLFYYHGAIVMGCMEHDTLRIGRYRKDHFWGGPWAIEADDNPPTHWMSLPKPPVANP